MEVKVDIKKLINQLETFNPEANLTGIKAYLLDLALNIPTPETFTQKITKTSSPVFQEDLFISQETPEEETARGIAKLANFKASKDSLSFWDEVEAVDTTAKTSVLPKTPEMRKKAREERRAASDYSNMSGKQIMESLAATSLAKKKPGQNQFIDLGAEGSSSDEDIVLG